MLKKYQKAMVFGVFDGLHDGHRFFLRSALKYCSKLIIVLSQNDTVKILKNHQPHFPIKKRMAVIKKEFSDSLVCAGDKKINTWEVVLRHKPDLIILGYDQVSLKTSLKKIQKKYDFKLFSLKMCFKNGKIRSSLLFNK